MIGRLKGIISEKQAPEILLDVNGVGYEVTLPMSCFYELPKVGEAVTLLTHFVVREDAQLLFGFNTKTERALFRELIKTNGVGPKLALAILSGMTADQFIYNVEQGEIGALVKLPGVGKKTAERLIVEMRDRLKGFGGYDLFNPAPESATSAVLADSARDEAVAALLALGYKAAQAEQAMKKIARPEMNAEQLIREALRSMG
ncbi:Holliday junction branch migration protein RuvA [Zobellella denitrificans]|uniref:Holliday junction branch migration complex subunit RuvA n=1 Tax=Zobellella denitrificans TaxID=347534 RepID=A0A231N138_9GAMM|nr:Holliday junction branch migration protein RuvA [Zobellella denitrificans]ATG73496.1 ATP-dependent DNA helicase RuvA [Zobellella denitrificans]OXS16010.1 Holliday junction branch migration protein RuvA [Zobellella denitrificans]